MKMTLSARDRRAGFNLEELENFVAQAKMCGMDGSAEIRVSIGFRSQIQSMTAKPVEDRP